MKFKFTIQPYQTEAVDSVVGVFSGQPYNDRFTYRRDAGRVDRGVGTFYENFTDSEADLMGVANAKLALNAGQLLENIRKMQARNNVRLSDSIFSTAPPSVPTRLPGSAFCQGEREDSGIM